jgi:hypothetical protein
MKLNRGGLICCGIYIGIFVLCIGLEFGAAPEAIPLLGLLAVFPAAILLGFSGLHKLIPNDSWMSSGYVDLALSLIISYLVGWAISWIVRRLMRLDEA